MKQLSIIAEAYLEPRQTSNVRLVFDVWQGSGDRYRTDATSKREHFAIIVNGWKLLTIITKCSISAVQERDQ